MSDYFSDLICDEDAGIFLEESPENLRDYEFPVDIEESIAGFVEEEGDFAPRFDYPARFQSQSLDASARRESVSWILKVQAFCCFQPLTAYLAVNYLDRFLSSRGLPFQETNGWPLQLLSIACLSLAVKMEEPLVPSLFDLQVEGAKYIFEPRTICKMELLVLHTLDWRLRSITPFTFIDFFATKADSTGSCIAFLVSRATQVILTMIREIDFLDFSPSSVAAASILHVANDVPNLSLVNPGNAVAWCQGLRKDSIMGCYKLMQEMVVVGQKQRKPPKVLPQHRVMTHAEFDSGDSSSSSSSSSFCNKRRKLNNDNGNANHNL